MEVSTENYIR